MSVGRAKMSDHGSSTGTYRIILKLYNNVCLFVCFWCDSPQWARASTTTRFLDHTQRRTTVGMTPPDDCSSRRRDLYLTTHNTHNRHISMPPVRFIPTISESERPQNCSPWDRRYI